MFTKKNLRLRVRVAVFIEICLSAFSKKAIYAALQLLLFRVIIEFKKKKQLGLRSSVLFFVFRTSRAVKLRRTAKEACFIHREKKCVEPAAQVSKV